MRERKVLRANGSVIHDTDWTVNLNENEKLVVNRRQCSDAPHILTTGIHKATWDVSPDQSKVHMGCLTK